VLTQHADRKRCATCERWSGARIPGHEARTVTVESETTPGMCRGGPWDGSERRARSACGHWLIWPAIDAPN